MKKEKIALILAAVLISLLFLPKNLLAAENDIFKLTYRLVEGVQDRLLLNDKDPYGKAVEITVTKKNPNVLQEFVISQNVGPGLEKLKDRVKMHRLSQDFPDGGYFYVQTNDMTVAPGESPIYKSDSAGTGLTFTLVYGLANTDDIDAGEYNPQINFILRPTSGTAFSQLKEPLYVTINIGEKVGIKPQIEITTATGSNTIRLNSKKEEKQTEDILVKINGSFKNQFTINQLIIKPLISNEGNQLDYEAINVQTQEVSKGEGIPKQPLSGYPLAIYKSDINGQADNEFIITYSLGDLSNQKAGRYKTTIQYYSEESGKQTPLGTLDLEVENERIFEIVITPEEQRSAIEFRDLKPREPPKKSEVTLEIKTNVGKQYQVSQNVFSELTDKEGNTIPFKYFTLSTESLDTKGTLKLSGKQPVEKGDKVLFVSDAQGSPDKFKLIYELNVDRDIKAGDYSTRITYSLLEI